MLQQSCPTTELIFDATLLLARDSTTYLVLLTELLQLSQSNFNLHINNLLIEDVKPSKYVT